MFGVQYEYLLIDVEYAQSLSHVGATSYSGCFYEGCLQIGRYGECIHSTKLVFISCRIFWSWRSYKRFGEVAVNIGIVSTTSCIIVFMCLCSASSKRMKNWVSALNADTEQRLSDSSQFPLKLWRDASNVPTKLWFTWKVNSFHYGCRCLRYRFLSVILDR